MKVLFRVDASVLIGTGHVMRCLNLAEGMREQGAEPIFVCREHEGNLVPLLRKHAMPVAVLPAARTAIRTGYEEWLAPDRPTTHGKPWPHRGTIDRLAGGGPLRHRRDGNATCGRMRRGSWSSTISETASTTATCYSTRTCQLSELVTSA